MRLTDSERACIIASLDAEEFDELLGFIAALKAQRQQVGVEFVKFVGREVGDLSGSNLNLSIGSGEVGRNQSDEGA